MFHYSDTWADPGQQTKPSAWKGLSFEELKSAVSAHTKEVLNALKAKEIIPEWVQVGNETRQRYAMERWKGRYEYEELCNFEQRRIRCCKNSLPQRQSHRTFAIGKR